MFDKKYLIPSKVFSIDKYIMTSVVTQSHMFLGFVIYGSKCSFVMNIDVVFLFCLIMFHKKYLVLCSVLTNTPSVVNNQSHFL
jgi:hypothetical protein